jgi:hypothetical protein
MLPTQDLLKTTEELQNLMTQATRIAERLEASIPELEEPAMRAQCSVMRAFLMQVERQEKLFSDMLRARRQVMENGHAA